MLQWLHHHLVYLDHTIWYQINAVWHNGFLDATMPFFRNQYFWAPLYLFLLLFLPANFGKRGWIWCLFFLISFALSDSINAQILKPLFHRTRPCNNPYLLDMVRLLVPRSSGLSFPSNHAANHFSMGMFMACTLGKINVWVWPAAMFWAGLVAYAQVYVGVHFPLDVFCGALLGIGIGLFTGRLFNSRFNLAKQPDPLKHNR